MNTTEVTPTAKDCENCCNCCDATAHTETPETLYDAIAAQPFFTGMNPRHLQILADVAMRTKFEPSQRIFQKDDPANRFYIILNGKVVLESPAADGTIHRVQDLGPHDVVGWSWLFPPYYWHFDAVAVEPTTAIFFYGTRLRDECEKDHDLGFELMKRISDVLISRLQVTRQNWIERK